MVWNEMPYNQIILSRVFGDKYSALGLDDYLQDYIDEYIEDKEEDTIESD